MKRIKPILVCAVFILLILLNVAAQKSQLRIGVQSGINKIFIGNSTIKNRTGNSTSAGGVFIFKSKNSSFSIEPSLLIARNAYYSEIDERTVIIVSQTNVCIMPVAALKAGEKLRLKSGFFVQNIIYSRAEVRYKTLTPGVYSFHSNDSFYEHYEPKILQAGIAAGITIPIGIAEKINFEFLLLHYGASVVKKEYVVENLFFVQNTNTILSKKSKPTVLLAGINYRIK